MYLPPIDTFLIAAINSSDALSFIKYPEAPANIPLWSHKGFQLFQFNLFPLFVVAVGRRL